MAKANPPMAKSQAFIIMIILGVGGAWMYGNYVKATINESQAPAKTAEQGYVPTPRTPSQAIDVTDAALRAAYDDNQARFSQQYVGKTVNVTGSIYKINIDSIMFQSSTFCYLAPGQNSKLTQLSKGQTVTVQGVVESSLIAYRIADCTIL
jgi:hypothetical protein